jgi:hypothetical protein
MNKSRRTKLTTSRSATHQLRSYTGMIFAVMSAFLLVACDFYGSSGTTTKNDAEPKNQYTAQVTSIELINSDTGQPVDLGGGTPEDTVIIE